MEEAGGARHGDRAGVGIGEGDRRAARVGGRGREGRLPAPPEQEGRPLYDRGARLFTVGIGFWFGYGIVLGSWPMIASNAITFVLAATILALKLRYG